MNNRKLKFIEKYIYSEKFQELKSVLKDLLLDPQCAIKTNNNKERTEILKLYELLGISNNLLDPKEIPNAIKKLYIVRVPNYLIYKDNVPQGCFEISFSTLKKSFLKKLTAPDQKSTW